MQNTVKSISGNPLTLPKEIQSFTSALGALQQQAANQELNEIMQSVQDEVDTIATLLGSLPDVEQFIVQGMVTYLKSGRQDLVNYHDVYSGLQTELAGIDGLSGNALKNDLDNCRKAVSGCDYTAMQTSHKKNMSGNIEKRSKVQSLMNELMPFEAAYQAWIKDISLRGVKGFGKKSAMDGPLGALLTQIDQLSSSENFKELLSVLQKSEELLITHLPQLDDLLPVLDPRRHTLGMIFIL